MCNQKVCLTYIIREGRYQCALRVVYNGVFVQEIQLQFQTVR